MSFGAELLGAVPLGMLSDAVSARTLMTSGALLAALATLLFGVTHDVSVFVMSRALEGLAAAAGVPALLAYLTDATADDPRFARQGDELLRTLVAGRPGAWRNRRVADSGQASTRAHLPLWPFCT